MIEDEQEDIKDIVIGCYVMCIVIGVLFLGGAIALCILY